MNFKGAVEECSVFTVQVGSKVREWLDLVLKTARTRPRAEELPIRQAPATTASRDQELVELLHCLFIHVLKQVGEVGLKEGEMEKTGG